MQVQRNKEQCVLLYTQVKYFYYFVVDVIILLWPFSRPNVRGLPVSTLVPASP